MKLLLRSAVSGMRERPREAGAATVSVLLVVLAANFLTWGRIPPDVPTAPVRQGTFAESLVESGAISAQRLMLYSSTIPGVQAKIVEIASEGSSAQPGDLLVRFDSTVFEQTRARERAALSQAEADLVRAREELRLQTLGLEGDLQGARQQVTFAETGLRNQVEGRGQVELAEADATAGEAVRELARAKKAYDDLKPLLVEGFITAAELDRAEQAWHRADEQRRVAEMRREALVRYEQPAATSRAQAELHAARDGVTRQTEAAASRASERRAAVAAAESRVQEIRARLAMLDAQIARTSIRASVPGLVVYRDLFFGSDKRKPQVGDEVWPNQPIIALPDSGQLVVETRVREIDLHRVAASQRVEVTVDAYPDLRLPATVALVGALAQEDVSRASTKFFPLTIKLQHGDERLRTGMTARAQIEVRSIPATLIVPIDAVFEQRGDTSVVVLHNGRWERRAVTVAATNEFEAAVSGPLAPGDRVALVDPLRAAPRAAERPPTP